MRNIEGMIDRDTLLSERDSLRSELAFCHRHVDALAEELALAQDDREWCRLRLEAADQTIEAADRAEPEPDADTSSLVGL